MLTVAAIAAAFVIGYQSATRFTSHRDDARSRTAATQSWQDVKREITQHWEASPGLAVDFKLREETLLLLDTIPVQDIEAWLRELPPEDYDKDEDKDVPLQLREMILIALAPRAAGSLVRSLADHPLEEAWETVDLAIEYWTLSDPVAVLDWLKGDVPQAVKEDIDSHRERALEILAGKNSDEFEKRLSQVDAGTREHVLLDYAFRRGSADERAIILARAARSPHGEAQALWQGLLRRESLQDPRRVNTTISQLNLSAADRASIDEALMPWLLSDYDPGDITDNSKIDSY